MKKIIVYIFLFSLLCSCSSIMHNGTMKQFYFQKKEFSWKGIEAEEFVVYYQAESEAEKNLTSVMDKITKGIEKAKKFTKIHSVKTPIYYFIVNDREEFKKLTKLNHSGLSYSKSNVIIESYFLVGEAHEVVHLLTHQNWGNSHTWIMEGIAVYSDNNWNRKNLEKVCFEYYKENKLIPVKELIKNSKFHHFDSQISYPQSGSLVKFLIQNFGWEKFLKFWKNPKVEKIYGLSENQLEDKWLNFIKEKNMLK